jgi:hypothetical protein
MRHFWQIPPPAVEEIERENCVKGNFAALQRL